MSPSSCVWKMEMKILPQKMLWQLKTGSTVVNNLSANAGDARDVGSIPGLARSPRGGHGNPLQYSCLEDFMDRGAWRATVHGVTKSQTLSD